MNREEFRKECITIVMQMFDDQDKDGIYQTSRCYESLAALYDKLLPPAKGAEEILQKYMDMSMIICPLHVVPRTVALDAMHEFATLHAQKLADKTVGEKILNFIHWLRYRNFTDDTMTDEGWLSLYRNNPDIPE